MHVKQFIEFISSSNHYTLETWPTGITVTWTVTWYLLAKYNHCHIVGTQTPYLSRPPAPTRSMLFTNRKSALARSSDKLCFPTLNGGKGVCVCQRLMTLIAIIAILLAHKHLIWVGLPLPPVQCCLQTVKAPSQGVRTNCAFQHWMGERGCVCANDLWHWLSIRDNLSHEIMHSGQSWKNLIFGGKKSVATG